MGYSTPFRVVYRLGLIGCSIAAIGFVAIAYSYAETAPPANADASTQPAKGDEDRYPANSEVNRYAQDESSADEPTVAAPTDSSAADSSADNSGAKNSPQEAASADDRRPTDATNETEEASGDATLQPTNHAPTKRKVKIDAASLKGVTPGRSTKDDVLALWGEPKSISEVEGETELTYLIEPFKKVVVTTHDHLTTSIIIYLSKSFTPDVLAKQLQIQEITPVLVPDDYGRALGQAYPERGVLFAFALKAKERSVAKIVLEAVDAQPFVLRAEWNAFAKPTTALPDVDYALQLAPKDVHSHCVRSRILAAMGDLSGAVRAGQEAIKFDAESAEAHLALSRSLSAACDFDGALQEGHKALALADSTEIIKSQAACQIGDCLANSVSRDFAQAFKYHQQAVKLAEPLAADDHLSIRRAAKEVLLDAHLSIACDVAQGRWQQKEKAVPKWLERAKAVAQDLTTSEAADDEVRFRSDCMAVAALASLSKPMGVQQFIDNATRVGERMIAACEDPAREHQLQWQLGLMLSDAVQITLQRARYDEALLYGQRAVSLLKEGSKGAGQLACRDYHVGQLYFRLGSVYALGKQDHKQALTWYDKAAGLLEAPVPVCALAEPRRCGETFVSMAVSYWEVGGREEAMRLTKQGVGLMEQAVEQGSLDKTALAVPYENLSSMLDEMGEPQQARQFSEMAAKLDSGTTRK